MNNLPAPILPPILPRPKADLRQMTSFLSREIAAALACGQVGTIQAFYPANQTADINFNAQIVVGYQTSASGQVTPVTANYPTLSAVPVQFLGGGGAASGPALTFPVAKGDECLLLFMDRDTSAWWTSGQVGFPPASNRLHDLSDAVALVGIRSLPNVLTNFNNSAIELRFSPTSKITVGASTITITEGSTTITTDGTTVKIDSGNGELLVSPNEVHMQITSNARFLINTSSNKLTMTGDGISLKTALDALFSALLGWVNVGGTTPNPATIAAITTAQLAVDAVLS